MKGIFDLRLLALVPGLALGLALILALQVGNLSASRPDKARQTYASLSQGHRGLVSLLKARQKTVDLRAVKLRRQGTLRLNRKPETTVKAHTEPDRIYTAPSPADAALIARSLAHGLRRVSPSKDHLPLLAELNRLSVRSSPISASLASTGDELPESNIEEIEPNDSHEQAQKIAYGDVVSGSSIPDRDLDIFSFDAGAEDYVRIDVQPEGYGWVAVQLFDSDSNLVSGGNYSLLEDDISPVDSRSFAPVWIGGNVIGVTLETGGTYFIVMHSYAGDIWYLDDFTEESGADGTAEEEEVSYRLMLTNPPTYELRGRVIDDTDAAVAGASAFIWPHDGTGGAQATTGEDGTFLLALPEGAYSATVEGPPGSRYPAGQANEQFRVGAGGTELKVVLRSGVIFSGQTVDDRGAVVSSMSFSLIDRENFQYHWAVSDEEGSFSVALFPGTYDIYLHATRKYPPQPVIRNVEILEDTQYTVLVDTGNRVSGRVLAPDGSPVAGAALSIYGRTDSRFARSDDQGFYEVALSTGTYQVLVELPAGVLLPNQDVGTLTVENDMEFDIRLAAGGIITGTVIDSRGSPVEGAEINLLQDWTATYTGGRPETGDEISSDENSDSVKIDNIIAPWPYPKPYVHRWLTTDSEGRWQAAVMPGSYTVEVVAPRHYPTQRLKAGVFEVGEGETVETSVVTIEHGVLFSGHIFLPDGSPMEHRYFQITIRQEERPLLESDIGLVPEPMPPYYPWQSYLVPVGAGGSFEVRLLPGIYCLSFDHIPGADGYPFQSICEVSLESDLEMDITLDAGFLVSGRVIDPEQTGLEGCWLSFFTNDGLWRGASSMSGSDGSFEVRLVAGDYYLVVQPVKGYFPDSLAQKLSLTGDTSLDIILRPGVRVFGRVTDSDGHPLPRVTVHLMAQAIEGMVPLPGEEMAEDDLSEGGAGLVSAILAGAVGLVDEDIPEPTKAEYDEEFLAGDSSPTGSVSEFDGSLIDLYIPGVPDADILIKRWPYWGWDAVAWTDVDGFFELRVRPGIYDLYAWTSEPGYLNVHLPGLDCTAELEVNLTLEAADIIVNGKVEEPTGTSADSVLVSAYDEQTGNHQAVYTDNSGSFELQLVAGVYELLVDGTNRYGEADVIESLKLDSDRTLKLRLGTGLLDEVGDASGSTVQLPRAFSLAQNSPNPFNPSTTISYTVAQPTQVSLTVYDLRGRTVKTLVERFVDAGTYQVQWYGKDSKGRPASSGVYFYRLQADEFSMVRKMVLLK